jgi:hypothetical protein
VDTAPMMNDITTKKSSLKRELTDIITVVELIEKDDVYYRFMKFAVLIDV